MKNLFTLLFVFFLHSASATNYYFSTVSGDDSRTPAQAQNPSTPWKTISKLNAYFSALKPGDAVLFKRGETFYGSMTITKSGAANSPIVIAAYGSGNKPVITSLTTMKNWVSKDNGIWESENSLLGNSVNTVLINGVQQELGRYPNSDAANKGYLTLEAHTSNTITDNELTSSSHWAGAQLVLRTRRWVTDRCPITGQSGHTITYAPVSHYSAIDGYGYFIENSIKTLDKFGEWYFNPSTKKLSIYFGSKAPSSFAVEATAIDNLITSQNYKYIDFDNLNIKGANANGINIRYGSNIHVTNCDVNFCGENGVKVSFHNYLQIENCTVSNSNANGINFGYSGDNAIIRNNKVTNTSVFAGMGGSGDGKGIGIQNYGRNTIIEYNEVLNSGYSGITFNGNSTVVKNNLIDSYCMTRDDGAGIYTYTGPSNENKFGRKVIGNIIVNGVGAAEGVNDKNPLAEGIYLDDNSSGVEITNNTIANIAGKGLFLNNARDLVVRNNTFYNNATQLYAHQYRKIKGASIRNLNVKQNIFFAKGKGQRTAYFTTDQDDNNLIGTLDSNYYARPLDERMIIMNSYVNNAGVRVNEKLDLEGWKNKYKKDGASKGTPRAISAYKINTVSGTNKFANGTFSASMRGVIGYSCKASLANSGQLDGGYLDVNPTTQSSSLFVNVGELKAGAKYLLKFSVRGSVSNTSYIGASLRKGGSPYTVFAPVQYRKVDHSRTDNEMVFTSSANEQAGQIEFKSDNQNKYYLDNIQLYEVDAHITNIDDSVRFVYNAEKVSKTVSLNGTYVDVRNNKYSNSIKLEAFQSAILIKADNEKKTAEKLVEVKVSPVVNMTSPKVNESYKATSTVDMSADATDADGKITKVEFYNGSSLLHSEFKLPYTYSWENVPAGNYTITAKATDNNGNVTTSASVSISVAAINAAPKVNITSPVVNATYKAAARINISADATDEDGKVTKVEYYNGTTLLHTETGKPYSWDWKNVRAGNYTITAVAIDDKGAATRSASVTISVVNKTTSRRSVAENDISNAVNADADVVNDDTAKAVATHAIALKPFSSSNIEAKTLEVKLYPNPAINKIQISVDGLQVQNQKAKMTITNLAGITIKSIPVLLAGKAIEADVTSLTPGMYILTIVSDNLVVSKKFIKS